MSDSAHTEFTEQITQLANTNELLTERLAALELALEDRDWLRFLANGEREFSREGLRTITQIARLMYIKNPLILRGVSVKRLYVWGQGVNIHAPDPDINAVLQAFMDDPKNKAELTSHQARMAKEVELTTDGNIFFVFFANLSTGKTRLRSIPLDEISEIITNPDDSKEPWYYARHWQRGIEARVEYHPDWRYNPDIKPATYNNKPVKWDAPVYHVKVGGFSDWHFGLSEVYAAIDWAKAYKSFLENWATIVQAYARFAFQLTTPGGKSGITAAKTKLQTTLGTGNSSETNPAPLPGSTFIAGEGVKIDPIRTSGATTSADDGRRMALMAMAVMGLPETFFGDASVGSLATAKSLDRPTELMMQDRQTLWVDIHRNIFDYVLIQAIKSPSGPLTGLGRVVNVGDDSDGTEAILWNADIDKTIDIDFPPIIADDTGAKVNSIVDAATLKGQPRAATFTDKTLAKMLLNALGEHEIDEEITKLFGDSDTLLNPPAPRVQTPNGAQPAPATAAESMMLEAVRELREAIAQAMREAV